MAASLLALCWGRLWVLRSNRNRDLVQVPFDQDHTEFASESKETVTARILWQVLVGLVFLSREKEF